MVRINYIPRVYTVSRWDFDNTPLVAFPTLNEAVVFVRSWFGDKEDEPLDTAKYITEVPLFGGYKEVESDG